MKPRLLLLVPTSTYRAEAFIRAAQKLPVDLSIASEAPNSLAHLHPVDMPTFDFSRPADAAARAYSLARSHPVHAVVAVDDQATLAAAVIAEALGLPHNPADAVRASINKFLARERMRAARIEQPRYELFSPADAARAARNITYPAVVKPLSMAASRGVMRVDTPAQLADALSRVAELIESNSARADQIARANVLVESYVPGWEVAVEGIMVRGRPHIFAVFDKPDPLEGPYFPETMYVTPSRLAWASVERIVRLTDAVVRAVGLTHGPFHVEIRGDDARAVPIEVHARSIGGLCSRVVRFADGRRLEDIILADALGILGDVPSIESRAAGVWMMQSPRRGRFEAMNGVAAACDVPGVEEVIVAARPGQFLEPLPEGFLYTGFIFARAETPQEVERSLRTAFARLTPIVHEAEAGAA
ncbi:MAG TPA: ATP-grasp domain-containing protein [Candidatus Krumholzibacteria bacterium]|nr:ATP-grasp domain-containing protein [Candidatus Krumholzibacteria bacterium]